MALSGCRPRVSSVLWYVVFFGFSINYMLRVNINIAIVSMVLPRLGKAGDAGVHVSECFAARPAAANLSGDGNSTAASRDDEEGLRFDWDERQQGLVLGAFFWFHWLTQVPGGMLARRFGTKLVFGLSNWVPCLLCFLVPLGARADFRLLVALRFLQGVVAGFAWPSMHNLTAAWVPPNERSKFVTAYMGILGTAWFCAWWLLVFNTPAQHPTISTGEREHIEGSIGQSKASKKMPTPWRHILLSLPMWMNVLSQWGNIWGLFTLMTQAPTYFKYIHGWGIGMTGLLSGVPHVCRIITAYLTGTLCDWLLQRNLMQRTAVRKLATAICCIGQGLFVLGLAFSGCNKVASVVFLALATGCSGAVSSGALASLIDLSPNFASIMFGISNTVTVAPGIISPIIVGVLTYNNQTVGQWQIVFLITAAMALTVGVSYMFCASSDLQPWNDLSPEGALDLLRGVGADKAGRALLAGAAKQTEAGGKAKDDAA
ncbi:sialin-like isoform X2 [Bacillus rossius redtenbacheri]|uniref:sialin-like isoform X2 n=1 Tax=Bacillus rossius redtenbacheri TaxID=93214 RepID=UPI002FDD94F8